MKKILTVLGVLAVSATDVSAQMITAADEAICELATTVEGYVQGRDLVLYADTNGVPLRVVPTDDYEVIGDLVDMGVVSVKSSCADGTLIALETEVIVADMAMTEETQSN